LPAFSSRLSLLNMPELPEVETTKNDLAQKAVSQKIQGFWIGVPSRVSFFIDKAEKSIINRTIESFERKGKNIVIHLSGGFSILIHQKISGHLLWGRWQKKGNEWIPWDEKLSERVNSFIHFIIFLDSGDMIVLADPRKFFKVEFWKKEDLMNSKAIKELGPDALEISLKEFKERISGRKQEIKKLLLNQSFVSGVGNIYSDEILWHARISPMRKASCLKEKEKEVLYQTMRKILIKALEVKGDSVSDYRLITGEEGGYQKFHKVYQRENQPCLRKDGGVIQRKKFGSRHLRYCPNCQL
jgi:formamidopyrimidine-DNA glycosylase